MLRLSFVQLSHTFCFSRSSGGKCRMAACPFFIFPAFNVSGFKLLKSGNLYSRRNSKMENEQKN